MSQQIAIVSKLLIPLLDAPPKRSIAEILDKDFTDPQAIAAALVIANRHRTIEELLMSVDVPLLHQHFLGFPFLGIVDLPIAGFCVDICYEDRQLRISVDDIYRIQFLLVPTV